MSTRTSLQIMPASISAVAQRRLADSFKFTHHDGSIAIGDPIPERILACVKTAGYRSATIMAADETSPYYNESGKAGSLYNEGWLPCITSVRQRIPAEFPRS